MTKHIQRERIPNIYWVCLRPFGEIWSMISQCLRLTINHPLPILPIPINDVKIYAMLTLVLCWNFRPYITCKLNKTELTYWIYEIFLECRNDIHQWRLSVTTENFTKFLWRRTMPSNIGFIFCSPITFATAIYSKKNDQCLKTKVFIVLEGSRLLFERIRIFSILHIAVLFNKRCLSLILITNILSLSLT